MNQLLIRYTLILKLSVLAHYTCANTDNFDKNRSNSISSNMQIFKKIQFEDEEISPPSKSLSKEETDSNTNTWGVSFGANYLALKGKSPNNFSNQVFSDISPGINLYYQKKIHNNYSIGTNLQFQRFIFSVPKENELKDNTANDYTGSFYLKSNFHSIVFINLELGHGSYLYLDYISNGLASIKTQSLTFSKLSLETQLPKILKPLPHINFLFDYKYNFKKHQDHLKIDGNHVYSLGVKIHNQNNKHAFIIKYEHSKSKINSLEQKQQSLKFQYQISFGEAK